MFGTPNALHEVKRVKSLGDALKMVDFIGRAPNGPKFVVGMSKICPRDSHFHLEVYGTEKKM